MRREDFVETVANVELTCIGSMAFIEPFVNPATREQVRANLGGPQSEMRMGGKHHRYVLKVPLSDFFDIVGTGPSFNMPYFRTVFSGAIAFVYELSREAGVHNTRPECQFLRHLRNAVSHGNRFYFKRGQPNRPAKFKEFEITSALKGTPNVLFDFLWPGDVVDLFRYIRTNA